MLDYLSVKSPSQRAELLEKMDLSHSTWLVSDLTSKFEVQKKLLKRKGIVEEDSVLRANEFWQKLLFRYFPQVKIVSQDFMKIKFSQWIKEIHFEWLNKPGASSTLLNYCNQLSPFVFHPEGSTLLEAWLEQNPESMVRWGHWAKSVVLLSDRIKQEKILCAPWVSGFLLYQEEVPLAWNRDLFVDLGCELTPSEKELFALLAKDTNVHLLMDDKEFLFHYPDVLKVYKEQSELQENLPFDKYVQDVIGSIENYGVKKMATQVSEVKDLTAEIRNLLEQGIDPESLLIVAPDIEAYWPVLYPYLLQEGIPVKKTKVVKLQSFPQVQTWLAKLRLSSEKVSTSDIQWALSEDQFSFISFNEFKRLFTVVLGEDDLERHSSVNQLYKNLVQGDKKVFDRDEFIAWSLLRLSENFSIDLLQDLYNQVFAECHEETVLPVKEWLLYFESLCGQKEVSVKEIIEAPFGIRIENFSSAHYVEADHIFFLGLNDQALRRIQKTAIKPHEINEVFQQTGFHITPVESHSLEFHLVKLLNGSQAKKHLYLSNTNFVGSEVSLSRIPLLLHRKQWGSDESVQLPQMPLLDKLQRVKFKELAEFRNWNEVYTKNLQLTLRGDLDSKVQNFFIPPKKLSLSASRMEAFLKCPFKFYAEKILGLMDLPSVDFDLDYMSGGKLIHKIFEEISKDFNKYQDEGVLRELIKACSLEVEALSVSSSLFKMQLDRYLKIAKEFIDFESEWHKNYPGHKIAEREFKINIFWNPTSKDWHVNSEEGCIPLVGYIDRIDEVSQKSYVVLDYKSSVGNLKYYGSWLEQGHLQLLIYAQAIEKLFSGSEVVAAQYYIVKEFNRSRGFQLSKLDESKFPKGSRFNSLSSEGKKALYLEANEKIAELVSHISAGEFQPLPDGWDHCNHCSWSLLCRASHLN